MKEEPRLLRQMGFFFCDEEAGKAWNKSFLERSSMMRHRPLVMAVCSWIAGSALAYLHEGSAFWLFWLGTWLVLPLLGLISRCPWKKLLIYVLIFSLGAAYWSYHDGRNVSRLSEWLAASDLGTAAVSESGQTQVQVRGMLLSPVEVDGDRADFTLRIESVSFTGLQSAVRSEDAGGEKLNVQLRLASIEEAAAASGWRRGQRLELEGTLERPNEARNFGGFDYRKYLRTQRVHWLLKAAGISSVKVEADAKISPSMLLGKVDAARGGLGERIERLFPDWQAGYMKGLLIGLASELEPEKYAQFSQLGLTHILAISGSHVAINVSLIFGVLRLCRVTRESAYRIVFLFIPVYVLITGFSPSVIRSGLMTMIGIYLLRRGFLKDGLNVLSAAALLMLLWEPYYMLNVSFQLSFIVTAGLIVFVPLLMPYLRWLPAKAAGAAAITVAAQLVSFPLTIYYFNQFSLLSLAANMLLVPIIGMIALPGGTAALLLSALWLPLGEWIAYPVRLLNTATFIVTEWLNARSGFMTYWKSPSLMWMAIFYAACYLLLYFRHRSRVVRQADLEGSDDTQPLDPLAKQRAWRGRRGGKWLNVAKLRPEHLLQVGLAGLLLVQLYLGYQPMNMKGKGHVQFIDVGQGDCALITTPEGRNILVDGGGTVSFRKPEEAWRNRREPFEVGAKTVVPLLKKRGINRLDAVILTHGDQDHAGGLQAVLEQFPVDALLINGSLSDSSTIAKLMDTALHKGIPIYAARQGMGLKLDAATELRILSPEPDASPQGQVLYSKKQNHESIVFVLQMTGATFLFTGDMDEAAEYRVLEELAGESRTSNLANRISSIFIDVMKIAHHGSKTSTSAEWLEYWRPAAAVISAGASNSYGHPHPSVVERIASSGSRIYRTDQHGEVQMEVENGRIRVRYKLVSPW
ncbi:ComEC/Rec2 family competence protein [Paenibacillus humicus]|uniref:ComEC/Rec2 family competence protein n=1 Tax=Paenibacillus humicus TaxID=412861 RepID=UPI003D2B37AF